MDLNEFCNRRSLNEKNFGACHRPADGKLRVAVMTQCTPSLGEGWQRNEVSLPHLGWYGFSCHT